VTIFAIHSSTRPRYPDSMSAADHFAPERRRFAMLPPRPMWIGVAARCVLSSWWASGRGCQMSFW